MPASTTAPPAGQGREVLRLTGPVVLWWIWLVFVAVNVGDFAIEGLSSARFGAVISAILLFVTGVMYTLALRPKVVTDSLGITVVNPYRVHHIPWPLVRSVDTGDWVRVHYAPEDAADSKAADSKMVYCWALYVSSRAKRKSARPRQRRAAPTRRGRLSGAAFGRWPTAEQAGADDYGSPWADSSRLPDEARYLASLPVAKAMAARLDTRAGRERARKPRQGQAAPQATASWSWPALAAAVIPAFILLIVAVA